MQINAINSTNFKNRFEEDNEALRSNYETPYDYHEDTDKFVRAAELTQKLVDSEDKKGFLATGATVLGIGASSFTKGMSITAGIDKLSGEKLSGAFEAGLKKGSSLVKQAAETLQANEGKKISKLAQTFGKGLQKTEELARNAYKAISTRTKSIAKEAVEGDVVKKIKFHDAGKGLAMISGIAAVLALVPGMLRKDNNNDGVADFKQKSQSVYDKNAQTMNKIGEKASLAVELAQLLS